MSELGLLVMRAHYLMNVLGAGNSGVQLLRGNGKDAEGFWGAPVTPPLAAAVIGSTWVGVALTSIAGLVAPVAFSPCLLFQFVYKTVFFFKSTLPALLRRKPSDQAAIKLGLIFLPYVAVLPFFLPWAHLTKDLRL